MAQEYSEIKTFKEAAKRLNEMAVGKVCSVQVSHDSYRDPHVSVSLYIDGIWVQSADSYAEAFAAMEAKIRALDSDHDVFELAAGVDGALAEQVDALKVAETQEERDARFQRDMDEADMPGGFF